MKAGCYLFSIPEGKYINDNYVELKNATKYSINLSINPFRKPTDPNRCSAEVIIDKTNVGTYDVIAGERTVIKYIKDKTNSTINITFIPVGINNSEPVKASIFLI